MYTTLRNFRTFSQKPLIPCKYLSTSIRKPSENSPHDPETSHKVEKQQRSYDVSKVTKNDMIWRTPWHEKEGKYYSTLRNFYSEENQTSILKMLHAPIDFSPSAIKKWWAERKEHREMMMQSYLPERNQMLGNELAAAHFIAHRGGAVKFHGQDKWVKGQEYSLPRKYQSQYVLEAIDCTGMNLYYEGMANLQDLQNVEWLSLNGVEQLDDWGMDRISNQFSHSLVYLDVRNCPNYTERGLVALYKMEKLKILCIDDMLMTSTFEMTCLMLQDANKQLDIKIGDLD